MNGSGDKILDWGVIIGALLLFAKTADVLSYFSPAILNDIIGFDVSLIYGIICALLVEGLALALHFNRRAALSSTANVVKWVLIGISGICQVFDGFITTGSVAQMSDTMKAGLSYGVPLIPLLITVMIFGIGHLPELNGLDQRPKRPFVGLRPMMNHLINGGTIPAPVYPLSRPREFDGLAPQFDPPEPNGSKAANPTTPGER